MAQARRDSPVQGAARDTVDVPGNFHGSNFTVGAWMCGVVRGRKITQMSAMGRKWAQYDLEKLRVEG